MYQVMEIEIDKSQGVEVAKTPEKRVLLFRYFEDNEISIREVSKTTGYKPSYLANLRSGSNELTLTAKLRFAYYYPETKGFLLEEPDEQ